MSNRVVGLLFTGMMMAGVVSAQADPSYIEFSVSGASGTEAKAINGQNDVTGTYQDSDGNDRGFIRWHGGKIISLGSFPVYPQAINNSGTVVGNFMRGGHMHAFLRTAGGSLYRFNVERSPDSTATSINSDGIIVGYATHTCGFIREADGRIRKFNGPSGTCTIPIDINRTGVVAGNLLNGTSEYGFLRNVDGSFVKIVPVRSSSAQVAGIDDTGAIAGTAMDRRTPTTRGFLRTPDGEITQFQLPGGQYTLITGVAKDRTGGSNVVGSSTDSNSHDTAFERLADGSIVQFDVPGAVAGVNKGTGAAAINSHGVVAGSYTDSTGVWKGFIRFP